MALEEARDLPCPFARKERANGVDEPTAGLHQVGGDV
jgi:hypothetical protein